MEQQPKIVFRNLTNVKYQQMKNAISKDKERPHLKGVYLDAHHSKLVVTDGLIVMCYDVELIESNELDQILIDPKIFNQATWISVTKDDLQLVEFHCTEEKTEVMLGEEVVAGCKEY
jgi:DNA polymerase III sliding clamp (beta) subunit (PCNA family)